MSNHPQQEKHYFESPQCYKDRGQYYQALILAFWKKTQTYIFSCCCFIQIAVTTGPNGDGCLLNVFSYILTGVFFYSRRIDINPFSQNSNSLLSHTVSIIANIFLSSNQNIYDNQVAEDSILGCCLLDIWCHKTEPIAVAFLGRSPFACCFFWGK